MRDNSGLNLSERNAEIAALRETLNDDKKRVSDELVYYKSVAKDIRKIKNKVEAAERAYERRETDKNAAKIDDAKEELAITVATFNDSESQIRLLLDVVQDDFSNLSQMYHGRKADKIMDAFEKYNSSVESRIIDIQAYTDTDDYIDSDEEEEIPMAIPEIPVNNGAPAQAAPAQAAPVHAPAYSAPAYHQYPQYIPVPMPMPYSYPTQQQAAPAEANNQTPNIAPVSIDVSPMLEKALEATLDKFTAAFDKKIQKFINEHPVDIPVAAAAPASAGSGEIAALEGLVLEDEQAIIDRLSAMIETLKNLTAAMNELSTLCAEISVKQSTANDMQKQTNDMQRQTLREQKGVQVGQRVINQDQEVINQEQLNLQDQQKNLLENHKALLDEQQAMEETHRLVSENQAVINEAMKAAVAAQKEVISAQQAISAGNAKALDSQNSVVEKQTATLALQREALVASRQILRDQKVFAERQKSFVENGTKKKAADTEAPAEEIVEAPTEA